MRNGLEFEGRRKGRQLLARAMAGSGNVPGRLREVLKAGAEEEQERGDDIRDNRDQSIQSTSCNFKEKKVHGGSECCLETHCIC